DTLHLALLSLFSVILLRPSCPPLFPYTTLFRSRRGRAGLPAWRQRSTRGRLRRGRTPGSHRPTAATCTNATAGAPAGQMSGRVRSEEHTSELQSRFDLVCRLLLEKKKEKRSKVI